MSLRKTAPVVAGSCSMRAQGRQPLRSASAGGRMWVKESMRGKASLCVEGEITAGEGLLWGCSTVLHETVGVLPGLLCETVSHFRLWQPWETLCSCLATLCRPYVAYLTQRAPGHRCQLLRSQLGCSLQLWRLLVTRFLWQAGAACQTRCCLTTCDSSHLQCFSILLFVFRSLEFTRILLA